MEVMPANAVIREWAAEHNVPCSPRGRIPRRVLDAYHGAATELLNTHTPEGTANRRLIVRFDPQSLSLWPESVKARRSTNRLKATVTEYVENTGSRTPNGGKFTSRRFTVLVEGEKWVGTVKNGTDVVKLRPYSEAYPNAAQNGNGGTDA